MKTVVDLDMAKFDQTVSFFEQMRNHPSNTTRAEEFYWELMAKLFKEVRGAGEEGKPFFTYAMSVPAEVFAAFGVPSIEFDMACGMSTIYLDCHDEAYKAAFALGSRPEIGTCQLSPIGWFAKGWFPRPAAVIGSNLDQCDNMAQNSNILADLYDVPTFSINRPYRWWSERGIRMMAAEIGDMISFVEELTSIKMDWDRLQEAVRLSKRMFELSAEIHKLVMATPCPLKGGTGFLLHWIRFAFAGRPEGVSYCEAFRDELKEKVARGEGVIPVEKFRLMSLFTPPAGQHRIHQWLEEECGAVLISEPYDFYYTESEIARIDPSKPLEALARIYYNEPYYRFYGPLEQYLELVLNDAIESKADAAINWFNTKCRMGGAVGKVVKDLLMEKAGIPTIEADGDMLDTGIALEQRLQDMIGTFLEMLESRRA